MSGSSSSLFPVKRPDRLVPLRVAFDARQVVDGRVIKLYAEQPRLRIEVRPIELNENVGSLLHVKQSTNA